MQEKKTIEEIINDARIAAMEWQMKGLEKRLIPLYRKKRELARKVHFKNVM
jgi:hypothetical protein